MNAYQKFKKKTFLVVEDDRSSRMLVKHFLESMDIQVVDAETGEKALDLLKHEKVEGILMDIALGAGMNGIDTGRSIKASGEYSEAPMIAVTTYERSQLQGFEDSGFTGYLQKPYTAEELKAALAGQVTKKRRVIY